MTSFSIVIPVHNRAHTLSKCVDSILVQSYKDFELILVDDHSSDNSVELAKSFAEKDERVRVLEQPDDKRGAQAARNAGILAAKFDWIMFNDSDDIWNPKKIEKEAAVLEKYNFDSDLVIYSDCTTINSQTGEKKYWALPEISFTESYKNLLVQSGPMFQSLLCSKYLLEKISLLDESVPSYQEWDTSIRLAGAGGKFVHLTESLFDYFVGASDAISKSIEKDFIGRSNIYNKFKPEIIRLHGKKKFKKMMAECFSAANSSVDFDSLKEKNEIIKLYEKNLIELFGQNYKSKALKFAEESKIRKFLRFGKRLAKKIIKAPIHVYRGGQNKKSALNNKTPVFMTPIEKSDSKLYLYQLSFFAEFYQYFGGKNAVLPKKRIPKAFEKSNSSRMFYQLNFGYFPVQYSYDDYFANCIKSPERSLIRKAIKNGYTCREINYDDYLSQIHVINTSKISRQGEDMSSDYTGELQPRQKIVSAIGQAVHTYGCFSSDGTLVAYYMFESFGKEILHTVKGIGHSDHLNFGIMNYLFAFSVGELLKNYPYKNHVVLYGGMEMEGGGLSRFKRNVGCKQGSPTINAPKEFYKDMKDFNKSYKIHGDTGLNFILDYL